MRNKKDGDEDKYLNKRKMLNYISILYIYIQLLGIQYYVTATSRSSR